MVRGDVALRGAKLGPGESIADGAWVDVAEGADITVRTSSYREITISGPALASICPNGDDELLLTKGRASAFPGTGVRPGVEVWIATPLGVLRYSDAKIEVDVAGTSRVAATAAMARADFAPSPGTRVARGADVEAPTPSSSFADLALRAGTSLVLERAAIPMHALLSDLVHTCTRASEESRTAAFGLANGDAGTALGERASEYVHARQRARLACETARAAAGPDALDESLLAELRAADEKRNQLTPLPARR
jgi:hypothetical protein